MADYLVKTNDGLEFGIDAEHSNDIDIVENRDGSYHLIHENKSYNISIVETDCEHKHFALSVNGKEIELDIKDSLDQMLDKMGFANNKKQKAGVIKSPMPGLVLGIDVKPGQKVEKGEKLLTLEAMKMENLIKSNTAGTIKSIDVSEGDAVKKNQLLLVIE